MRTKLLLISGGAIAATAIGLSACSSTDHDMNDGGMAGMHQPSSASSGSSPRNAADIMFAQMMIPHHQGAIEMADLAPSRSTNSDVLALAAKIKAAQAPEIDQMQSWLSSWGQPTGMPSSMGHDMPGMMSEQDVATLQGLSGAAFDRQFLTMMIAHHQGAIEMAETEIANGSHAPAIQLANDIITSQQAEIAQMEQMLTII